MSKDQLKNLKKTSEMREYKKPSELKELSTRYWKEIRNRFYNFDRYDVEIELLRSSSKADLLALFKVNQWESMTTVDGTVIFLPVRPAYTWHFSEQEVLDVSSPNRRKLAVYVFPKHIKQTSPSLLNSIPRKVCTKWLDFHPMVVEIRKAEFSREEKERIYSPDTTPPLFSDLCRTSYYSVIWVSEYENCEWNYFPGWS